MEIIIETDIPSEMTALAICFARALHEVGAIPDVGAFADALDRFGSRGDFVGADGIKRSPSLPSLVAKRLRLPPP